MYCWSRQGYIYDLSPSRDMTILSGPTPLGALFTYFFLFSSLLQTCTLYNVHGCPENLNLRLIQITKYWIYIHTGSSKRNSLGLILESNAGCDFLNTSLSCGRLIRLLAHPLPPLRQQVAFFLCLPVCRGSSFIDRGGHGRGWARSQITWPRESRALSKSFNTLRGRRRKVK